MYAFRYDADELALVGLHAGPPATPSDFERAVESIERLAQDANEQEGIATMIVVVECDDVPDPTWRKRIAAAEGKPYRMCRSLVTRDAVIRGVGTAIAWMGPQTGIERTSHLSFDEAVAWIESRVERPMHVFPHLLASAWQDIPLSARKIRLA